MPRTGARCCRLAVSGWLSVLVLAGCTGGHVPLTPAGPGLIQPGTPNAVTDEVPVDVKTVWAIGSITLCLDGPGRVDVTSVAAYGGNVDVVGFGLRPNPFLAHGQMVGALDLTLKGLGIPAGPQALTIVCDQPEGNSSELVLQVRAGATSTRAKGVKVSYESAGQTRELSIEHGLILCLHPTDVNDATCKIR